MTETKSACNIEKTARTNRKGVCSINILNILANILYIYLKI